MNRSVDGFLLIWSDLVAMTKGMFASLYHRGLFSTLGNISPYTSDVEVEPDQ